MEGLLNAPPPLENWPEWVGRVKALLSQYKLLQKELRPALSKLLLVPEDLTRVADVEVIPNILLRTKRPPEVEERLMSLRDSDDKAADLGFKILGQISAEVLMRVQAEKVKLDAVNKEALPKTTPEHKDFLNRMVRFYLIGVA